MTNWTSRDMTVDFSFLPQGQQYVAEIYKDGKDAGTNANSYVYETLTVDSGTKMNVWLAPGGGIAMRLSPASRSGK